MKKSHKIIYWIATIWLSLGMLSTGLVQILQLKEESKFMLDLGFPTYFMILLGVWKIPGVIVLLLPKLPLLKEWAYAGFFFTLSGAIVSHMASGDPVSDMFPALLLLILTILSWYFRPVGRKIISAGLQY